MNREINNSKNKFNQIINTKEQESNETSSLNNHYMIEDKFRDYYKFCHPHKKKNLPKQEVKYSEPDKEKKNDLFDLSVQNACIKYLNNNYEKEYFLKCIDKIQCNMDKYSLDKTNVLKNNGHVFLNLINKTNLIDKISKIFYKKYLLLLKYNNNLNTDNLTEEEIRFLIHCRHDQSDINDFDYYFFNYLKKLFDNFISDHRRKILYLDYKYDTIPKHNLIFYKIFDNFIDELYYKDEIYNEDIDDNERINNLCIIEHEILSEPVKLGKESYANFNQLKIWVDAHGTCPLTREELKIENLEVDKNKKKEVEEWKKKRLCKEICKTKCCNKEINYDNFKEEFLKKFENNYFNEMKCDNCNKFYFI